MATANPGFPAIRQIPYGIRGRLGDGTGRRYHPAMTPLRRLIAPVLPLAGLFAASPALAQGRPAPATWTIDLGAAPVVSPVWQGSRDYALSVFPDLRVNWRDTVMASIPEGLRWHAIASGGLTAGPIARLRFGRNEDGASPFRVTGGSTALAGMGRIGVAGEIGGFAQYDLGRSGVRLRGEVRKGFGGHDGVVGEVQAGYGQRTGRTIWAVNARATFATAGYLQTYFGVDAAQSAATGLGVSRPAGGLVSYGAGGNVIRRIDERIALTGFASYERLAGKAAGTTLIRQRGDADQVTAGLGISWRFRIR